MKGGGERKSAWCCEREERWGRRKKERRRCFFFFIERRRPFFFSPFISPQMLGAVQPLASHPLDAVAELPLEHSDDAERNRPLFQQHRQTQKEKTKQTLKATPQTIPRLSPMAISLTTEAFCAAVPAFANCTAALIAGAPAAMVRKRDGKKGKARAQEAGGKRRRSERMESEEEVFFSFFFFRPCSRFLDLDLLVLSLLPLSLSLLPPPLHFQAWKSPEMGGVYDGKVTKKGVLFACVSLARSLLSLSDSLQKTKT